MYGSSYRNSSLPMVTFICGVMLLVALLSSTGILEQRSANAGDCQTHENRLSRALGGEETTKLACLGNYRSFTF